MVIDLNIIKFKNIEKFLFSLGRTKYRTIVFSYYKPVA